VAQEGRVENLAHTDQFSGLVMLQLRKKKLDDENQKHGQDGDPIATYGLQRPGFYGRRE
jgi:hypothetical protein